MATSNNGVDYMKNDPNTQRLVDMIEDLMAETEMNYSKMSTLIVRNGKPISRQAFFKQVKGGSLKVTTLMEVLDGLGRELKIEEIAEED